MAAPAEQGWRAVAPLLLAVAVLGAGCTAPVVAELPASSTTSTTAITSGAVAPIPEASAEESKQHRLETSAPLPDLTARSIDLDDLTAMLPPGDTGVAGTDAELSPTERSNDTLLATAVLDYSDEEDDISTFGRVTGIAAVYPAGDREVHVWIDLFEDTEGASGWLADTARDIVKFAGGSHAPSIALDEAVELPFDGVGEESIAMLLTLDDGALSETMALFRIGRIVAFTSIVRLDDVDARVQLQYLAEEVADRIPAVLAEAEADETPTPQTPAYRFTFERTVVIGTSEWSTTSAGTFSGDSVECRVRIEHPDFTADRELRAAGERIWSREDGGAYEETGSGDPVDRTLLALCPAWPLDVSESGLADALDGYPAEDDVGGLPSLGYLGGADDLAGVLGIDADAVTVDVFNIWVLEGEPWLIEVDLAVSGDTTVLADVIGPGFPSETSARVTLRHRVSDLTSSGTVGYAYSPAATSTGP